MTIRSSLKKHTDYTAIVIGIDGHGVKALVGPGA